MIVADTDVLIDFLRGVGAAERVALELENGALWTTAVTRFELMAGARSDRQRVAISDLLGGIPTLALDESAADEAADIRRDLEARGESIGMADSLIAGIVRANRKVLLTRNRKHFERVVGLELSLGSEG
jgi:tRNA(fMet)-specific endonuclease VapC